MVYFPGLSRQNWPHDPQELDSFYGNPRGQGDADPTWKAQNLVPFSYPWHEKGAQSYLIHKKVLPSLMRVLNAIFNYVGHDQTKITFYHLDETGGTFNYRPNRNAPRLANGEINLSNHSYGIAIDLAPDENPNRAAWVDQAPPHLPRFVVEAFKQEGWRWGSDFTGTKDAMHFEAVFDQHHDQQPVPAPQPTDPQAATTAAPVPVALQPVTPGPLVPSTGTSPAPLVALAEAAATLVARQLIQASPQGAQIAAELRAQAVIGREIADLVIALLDKVAPVAPVAPAAPAQPLPAPQRPPIDLPLSGTPLPDFLQPMAPDAPPLVHFVGKCSWFGGPNDMGVSPSEGLAIFSSYSQAPNLFLPQQPPGTTGLARRLDPSAYYIACRWDYHRTPVTMLRDQSVQATVRANGREFLAHPADWGPNEKTGRVADLSHGLLTALGISTDDQVEVIYPATKGATIMSMPSTQPQPAGDTQVAAPLGTVLSSKVNLTQPIAILAQVAAVWIGQKMGLDAMTQGALAVVIQTVVSTATVIFRTWYTTKILPQSLPLPARNQLGV